VLVIVALTVAGCGSETADEGPFAYDSSQPLAFDDLGVVDPDYPVAVHDVSYGSSSGRVEAFLVVPPGDGPWPAAVYVHGAGSDRLSMLGPATWLAARGAVTLAISAPSGSAGEPKGATGLARLEEHRAIEVADVVAVRRAVDLLRERDDVDPDRIGYVGWSAGARTGSILAGLERRLHSLVLIAPGAARVAEYVEAARPEDKAAVEQVMSSIDPLAYIARGDAESLLIQEAEQDRVIPRTAIDALVAAAPEGTEVRWYDTGHAMGPKAYAEHLDWLQERLGITGPAVPGAQTGPA
jgi:dienelactone hydrolase